MTEPAGGRIVVDGRPIAFAERDSVAVAILRAGEVPGHGGCLCLAGDCGNCLAEVDGIAYVRTCQVAARPGPVVAAASPRRASRRCRSCDQGDLGRTPAGARRRGHAVARRSARGRSDAAAGRPETSLILDAAEGIGGRRDLPRARRSWRARRPGCSIVRADEIVVATGSAEIQPVCPGTDLAGIVTAARRRAAGDGRRRPRRGSSGSADELVRFEGDAAGHVTRRRDARGRRRPRRRRPCDTVVVDLGRAPRDVLARMVAPIEPCRVVGSAARRASAAAAPRPSGVVCRAWARPSTTSRARATRATPTSSCSSARAGPASAPCQGGACLPHVRAFLAARTGVVPEPFTARPPPARSRSRRPPPTSRSTPSGGRRSTTSISRSAPGWTGSAAGGGRGTTATSSREYWAVREGVSIGDVSTLGKLVVSGPGRRRGARADLPVPRRGHQARPLALRAAPQRARPRDGRRDDPPRRGDAVRADVHVRRRRERRDVAARLDRHVGPPRPRHGPDDVARRDQRHGAARRGAAPAPRPRRAAAVPGPRPGRGRAACPAT